MLAMADLRAMLSKIGFASVQTLLQSGNLVFLGDGRDAGELERLLEVETRKRLHVETDFFIRTPQEWARIVERNPFPKEARADPGHLVLMVLRDTSSAKEVKTLQQAIVGPECVRGDGRQLYITYPAGQGRSRLTNAFIEKKIRTRGTARNWNTVLKIAALVKGNTRV